MKKTLIALLLILGLAYLYLSQDFEKTPDTLYINGNIITMNDAQPRASSMLVEDGVISLIGDEDTISIKKKFDTVDLKGATVLPGFIDSHSHVALSSFLDSMVDLSGFKHQNNAQVWQHLKSAVAKAKPGDWIVCKGMDPILVEDLQTPDRKFLDELAPNNPVVILSQSLHTYWANTQALDLAGIDKNTPNPSKSSYYEKDAMGELTGLIAEQEAFIPLSEMLLLHALNPKVLVSSTSKVMKDYAKSGNTTVVSAGISVNDKKPFRLYEHLSSQKPRLVNQLFGKLGFLPERSANPRHFMYIRFDRTYLLPEKKTDNDFYNILGVKHWYDGSPYTGSMYLQDPYKVSELTKNGLHIPDGSAGKALITKDDLTNFIKEYHRGGWQIAIHAQGDNANSEVIAAFANVNQDLDITQGRHRLEHCLLINSENLQTLSTLNMTPNFHINHLYYYGKALQNDIIGSQRANSILPIADAENLALKYSMHADQPMFESKPFHLIQTAVERKTKEGELLGIDQAIKVQQALKAMTLNAAWQINMETKIGSLELGKYADFIVIDKDPLSVHVQELSKINVLDTFVHGNLVD